MNRPDSRDWPTPPPSFEVDPKRSAVVLIDFQRMQAERGCGLAGRIEKEFPEISKYFFTRIENVVLPASQRLVAAAHARDIPVFYLTIGPERSDGGDLAQWKRNRNRTMNQAAGKQTYFFRGTAEHGLLRDFKLTEGDVVLNKTTFNGFTSTSLDMALRAMDRTTLFIGGQATNVCVQATSHDAADRGYQVVLVEDACGAWDPELHAATIRNFGLMYGAVSTIDEALGLLERGGTASGRPLPVRKGGNHVAVVDVEVAGCDIDAFNRWYDEVHVPEVLACPGFLSAKRWQLADGSNRFLAIYEIAGPWAMETPEVVKIRGWSHFEPYVTVRRGLFSPRAPGGVSARA